MSIEQAQGRPDDLQVDQSQVTHPSAVGAGYTMTQNQESGADGQPSEDEDNRMNYKFGAQAQQTKSGTASAMGSRDENRRSLKGRASMGAAKQPGPNMPGQFLQSKQMVFGADKRLVPTSEANFGDLTASQQLKARQAANNSYGAIVNQSGALQGAGAEGRSENVLEAAHQISEGKTQLKQIINILEEDKIRMAADSAQGQAIKVPETEEEIMVFLEQAHLENQPTDVLYQLADKLKERRTKLYPEEKMLDAGSDNLGFEDEEAGLETDRKAGKSDEINFELGSEQQLKKMGSSQVFDQAATNPAATPPIEN